MRPINKDLLKTFIHSSNAFKDLKFIISEPDTPCSIETTLKPLELGVNYETSWGRKKLVTNTRNFILDFFVTPALSMIAAPSVKGAEILTKVDPPVIFVANHSSHVDTPLILSTLPVGFRNKLVVAAAADYFFSTKLKSFLSTLTLNAIPIERNKINRASAELPLKLLNDRWNLLIFPEGTRSSDGWMGEFKGGAAYLSVKANVKIIPIHIAGARKLLKKGSKKLVSGTTEIRFGPILEPETNIREFNLKIQKTIAMLADEASSNYYEALKRFKQDATPDPMGPNVSPWRRSWLLPDWASSQKQVKQDTIWPKI